MTVCWSRSRSNATSIPAHSAHPPALAAPVLPKSGSVVPITLAADLGQVAEHLKKNIPTRLNADNLEAGDGKRFRYTFDLIKAGDPKPSLAGDDKPPLAAPGPPDEENPKISLSDGRIFVTASYRGDIEAKFFPGFHLQPVFPVIHVSFRPGIIERENKFVLGATDVQSDIKLAPGSDTTLGAFGLGNLFIDVKAKLQSALNGPKITAKINAILNSQHRDIPIADFHGPFRIPLASGPDIWLYPNPSELSVGELSGSLASATLNFQLRGYPTIFVGADPPQATVAPIAVRTELSTPADAKIKIFVPIVVPYATITEQVKKYFATRSERSIEKWKCRVEDISFTDAAGRVLVAIKITGELNGTFYLWGTPHVGADGASVSVPDLQLAAESKTLLDAIKADLAKILFRELGREIKPLLKFDLRPMIARAGDAMSKTYTAGGAKLNLNLHPTLAAGSAPIYSRPEGIVVNVYFDGSARAGIAR
jgi:hypothetical protein